MGMDFTPASLASQAAFVVIVVVVLGAIIAAVNHAYGSFKATAITATLLGLWLGLQSALVISGIMPALPLMGLPVFFAPVLVGWIGLAFSPVGSRLVASLPLGALVAFQGFRLPLELVLHAWFKQGTIPETMTWSGYNWDIISGIVALICAPLAGRFRIAARVANIVGFALLLNVMRVAILSSPVPFGWDTQPPLLLAFHLPYALIVPVCVGGALFGHILLTRALWRKQSVPR